MNALTTRFPAVTNADMARLAGATLVDPTSNGYVYKVLTNGRTHSFMAPVTANVTILPTGHPTQECTR